MIYLTPFATTEAPVALFLRYGLSITTTLKFGLTPGDCFPIKCQRGSNLMEWDCYGTSAKHRDYDVIQVTLVGLTAPESAAKPDDARTPQPVAGSMPVLGPMPPRPQQVAVTAIGPHGSALVTVLGDNGKLLIKSIWAEPNRPVESTSDWVAIDLPPDLSAIPSQ